MRTIVTWVCRPWRGYGLSARRFPEIQIILDLSNLSFDLNPVARYVLNSAFLDHAVWARMTGAIVHLSKITPLRQIAEEGMRVAEDLIFDRCHQACDPFARMLELLSDHTVADGGRRKRAETVKERNVDGNRKGLEADLAEAIAKGQARLAIINDILLEGMKIVGEMFGAGKMQLPFVLRSAETMTAAVPYLEPFMECVKGQVRGTVVLATVKGDVYHIGNDLIHIILTNNGYRVINLDIKVLLFDMLKAANENNADALGVSGLFWASRLIAAPTKATIPFLNERSLYHFPCEFRT